MDNEIIIEKATEKDIEKLNSLYTLLSGELSDPSDMRNMLKTFIDNEDYYLLVIKLNGTVIGTGAGIVFRSLANNCLPYFVIDNVAIDPEFQHMGFGTKLFEKLHECAKERKCCFAYLVAESDNMKARSFYTKMGYIDDIVGFQKHIFIRDEKNDY